MNTSLKYILTELSKHMSMHLNPFIWKAFTEDLLPLVTNNNDIETKYK